MQTDLLFSSGGAGRSRTDLHGFAILLALPTQAAVIEANASHGARTERKTRPVGQYFLHLFGSGQ
jgi:hypothetical protein